MEPWPGTLCCSWARHFTLMKPLSTQVYKWVPANLMLGANPAMDWHPVQGGVEILLVASCYRNWDKLRPDGPQLAQMQTLPIHFSLKRSMKSSSLQSPSLSNFVHLLLGANKNGTATFKNTTSCLMFCWRVVKLLIGINHPKCQAYVIAYCRW